MSSTPTICSRLHWPGLAASTVTRAPLVIMVLCAGREATSTGSSPSPSVHSACGYWHRRGAAFVCLTQEIEEELASRGFPRERLRRIANGVDASHFRRKCRPRRADPKLTKPARPRQGTGAGG